MEGRSYRLAPVIIATEVTLKFCWNQPSLTLLQNIACNFNIRPLTGFLTTKWSVWIRGGHDENPVRNHSELCVANANALRWHMMKIGPKNAKRTGVSETLEKIRSFTLPVICRRYFYLRPVLGRPLLLLLEVLGLSSFISDCRMLSSV